MSDLLDRLTAIDAARREDNDRRYAEFVRLAAIGERVEPVELIEFLDTIRRPMTAFQADVETVVRRGQLRETMDRRPEAVAELEAIAADVARRTADFEQVRRQHLQDLADLEAHVGHWRSIVAEAKDARRQLLETCPDAALIAEHDRLAAEHRDTAATVSQIRRRLAEIEPIAAIPDTALVAGGVDRTARVASARTLRDRLRGDLTAAEANLEDLAAAIATNEQRRLVA